LILYASVFHDRHRSGIYGNQVTSSAGFGCVRFSKRSLGPADLGVYGASRLIAVLGNSECQDNDGGDHAANRSQHQIRPRAPGCQASDDVHGSPHFISCPALSGINTRDPSTSVPQGRFPPRAICQTGNAPAYSADGRLDQHRHERPNIWSKPYPMRPEVEVRRSPFEISQPIPNLTSVAQKSCRFFPVATFR